MAISKTVTFKDIEIKNSYIVAVTPTIHTGNLQMSFGVNFSVKAESPTFFSNSYQCDYSLEGENPLIQAYEYLKTLEEFEGCIDC